MKNVPTFQVLSRRELQALLRYMDEQGKTEPQNTIILYGKADKKRSEERALVTLNHNVRIPTDLNETRLAIFE